MDHTQQLKALTAANKQLVAIANNLLAVHNADTATIVGLRSEKGVLTSQLVEVNTAKAADEQELQDYDAAAADTIAQVAALQQALGDVANEPAPAPAPSPAPAAIAAGESAAAGAAVAGSPTQAQQQALPS